MKLMDVMKFLGPLKISFISVSPLNAYLFYVPLHMFCIAYVMSIIKTLLNSLIR